MARLPTSRKDCAMDYMLLIYQDESGMANATPEDFQKVMAAFGAYSEELAAAGVMKDGNGLQPTSTATTVRVRDGKTQTSDGPFGSAPEQFGGYYVLSCDNLDDALKWAAKCPAAPVGSIEVRPIIEM